MKTPLVTDPIIALVGPTGTGKSALALDLAEALDAEIVNADASQLYRGMDIGTAKLLPSQRRGIRHHQLDVLDVTMETSVAAYQRAARADLADIRARGHRALLVGGSGLYVRSVLDDLEIPPRDTAVRDHFEAYAAQHGAQAAHLLLQAADPVAAQRILPTNTRRVVRALEVIELTGRPFSATLPVRRYLLPTITLGLALDRPTLDERLARRAESMWAQGLLDEVRTLIGQGLAQGPTALRAIGYQQALAQLDGVLGEGEAIAATVAATRRLVRRQESWWRPDPRVHWLPAEDADLLGSALAVVAAGVGENGAHDQDAAFHQGPRDAQ